MVSNHILTLYANALSEKKFWLLLSLATINSSDIS